MLTKDLLRVSRAGGGYRPRFADRADRPFAARVLGVFQGHVGATYGDLQEALADLERDAEDFKLVRGFAKLLERDVELETHAPLDPVRVRRALFEAAEPDGVVTRANRERAVAAAADSLGLAAEAAAAAMYADRETNQRVAAFDARWSPDGLLAQYNLSLAQTALFDATELRVESSDPRALVAAVKRLGLMYEILKTPEDGREVVLTGPDAIFRRTRRYGTRFARLLRTLVGASSWRLEATVDDRGRERTLVLDDGDPLRPPDAPPVVDVSYDSGVERDFAARFAALDLDWTLVREPAPLDAGDRVMIPDFAFDYVHGDGFRLYFEVMGFWTPDYVEKKLAQLAAVEDVELLVAVDRSLGVGEEIAARDHRVVAYDGTIPMKAIRAVLREYETPLVARAAASLPDELVPEADVLSLAAVADAHGVSEDALADVVFPEHRLVGRTLVRPAVLEAVADDLDAGMNLEGATALLADRGLDDASAVLSALGYRVEWSGLAGGTLREKE